MLPGQERLDVERGGKSKVSTFCFSSFKLEAAYCWLKFKLFFVLCAVIMPPSALDSLTRLNIVYPMLFKLTNRKMERGTHCGVLEFVADEGKVYLPYWVQKFLLTTEWSIKLCFACQLDDAEPSSGWRWPSSDWKCFSASGHILQVPASVTRFPGHHEPESRAGERPTQLRLPHQRRRHRHHLQRPSLRTLRPGGAVNLSLS